MNFSEKLQILRKTKAYTQESLAEKLNVSRQAIAKWEAGQAYPDIMNLINISELMNVTVDYLVKDQECSINISSSTITDLDKIIKFKLEAIKNTYAGQINEVPSTRLDSHDFRYEKGEYVYHDSYVGGEKFAGEEVIFRCGKSIYAMNYVGRVLDEKFSGSFLKEVLKKGDENMPYRGPEYYKSGEYIYKMKVVGDISWFQGYEVIYYNNSKVYECYFHGGTIR